LATDLAPLANGVEPTTAEPPRKKTKLHTPEPGRPIIKLKLRQKRKPKIILRMSSPPSDGVAAQPPASATSQRSLRLTAARPVVTRQPLWGVSPDVMASRQKLNERNFKKQQAIRHPDRQTVDEVVTEWVSADATS
jgi:hypothetical protein